MYWVYKKGLQASQKSLVCNKTYEIEHTTVQLQQGDMMGKEGRRQVPEIPSLMPHLIHRGAKATVQHHISNTPKMGCCFPPHVSALQRRWVPSR